MAITSIRDRIRKTARACLDQLLPSECLGCGALTGNQSDALPSTLCESCYLELTPDLDTTCDRCGAPLGPHASPRGKCPHCRGRSFCFKSVTCLGMYEGLLRRLLVSGKWSHSSNNVRSLARALVDCRGQRLADVRADRLIPIPQIWHRRFFRNFNAASLVATEISRVLRQPVDTNVLHRSRSTRPQKRASVADRTAIQKDSFRIGNARAIRGETLLLVDDVLTTGATCNEAVRMLLDAGATECHVAVLARVSGTAS